MPEPEIPGPEMAGFVAPSLRRHEAWRRLNRRAWLTSVVAVGLGTVTEASAHGQAAMSLDELVRLCAHVVVVHPVQTHSVWEWDSGARRIVTYTTVDVLTNVDGRNLDAPQPIVQTRGGRVGDVGQLVHGEAQFDTGEPSVCFLSPDQDGIHHVVGRAQGLFPLYYDDERVHRLRATSSALHQAAANPRSAVELLRGRTLSQCQQMLAEVLP